MGYRWKPSKFQAREYAERMKQREELPIIRSNKAIRNGCFVSFHSKYHNKVIKGNVVNNSYGENTNQHTFTIEENGIKYKVKGRNLYDSLLEHIPGEESIKISL
jgi:23S rRNA G2069 N7-methylase RlmK/C1962 C5-methylase RlmI